MSKKVRILLTIMIFIAGLLLGNLLTSVYSYDKLKGTNINTNIQSEDDFFDDAKELKTTLKDVHYLDIKDEDMREYMLKGMVQGSKDQYSAYLTKEEFEEMTRSISGKFEGIGIVFYKSDKGFIVNSIIKDSPAQKANIKPGYIIYKVDGKTFDDLDLIGAAIRGKKDTKVKIEFINKNGKKITKEIVRSNIKTESVIYKDINEKVFYIRITDFQEDTYKDFMKAVKKGINRGKSRMILDLRNNPGGLVDVGLNIADSLLEKSTITTVRDKEGDAQVYKSDEYKLPVKYVVLANNYTASTSEIILSAIKDNKGGKIVGTRSFGKGYIQTFKKLSSGDVLKYTKAEYVSPKGYKIHGHGVKPNYYAKSPYKQYQKALSIISK